MTDKIKLTPTNQNLGDTPDDSLNEKFVEDPPRAEQDSASETDTLLLNIDGYEGPITVLLDLARSQKVDLHHISILQLVRQYLAFIERAKELQLELAAEYLVMAAWLAYLKSRLLLPKDTAEDDEPSGEEMAAALQFQLRRLEAMQDAGEALMKQPRLGQRIFARGMPTPLKTQSNISFQVSLYDLLTAYGAIERRKTFSQYKLATFTLMSMDEASERLEKMLGKLPRKGSHSVWTTLHSFLPERLQNPLFARSSLASLFTAGLEMAKQGQAEIRQDGLFRPIYLRQAVRGD